MDSDRARRAFDVLKRRKWSLIWNNADGWFVTDDDGPVFRGEDSPDPVTAVLNAEKWYVENIEKRG